MMNREHFTALDIVKEIWTHLELPAYMLSSLSLPDTAGQEPSSESVGSCSRPVVRSSFKIGHLAQSTIALSALAAAAVYSSSTHVRGAGDKAESEEGGDENENRGGGENKSTTTNNIPKITIPLRHAILEFQSEKLYTLAGRPPISTWGPIGGLHPTRDGHVRIHDAFPHHRAGALNLLGLEETCVDRDAVSEATRKWGKLELERVAVEERGLAVYALRSFGEWDCLDVARAVPDLPVRVTRVYLDDSNASVSSPPSPSSPRHRQRHRQRHPTPTPTPTPQPQRKLLTGLRVLELTRVIAGPVAGKTLASHGADVLWLTSPLLPALPGLDVEFARGKRSVRIDLTKAEEMARFMTLVRDADVVVQNYRPDSLGARGLDVETLARARPGIVLANLAAFGPPLPSSPPPPPPHDDDGSWSGRRGFDSLVQTCSGIAVSEAEHFGAGEAARALPCQALDHGAGFLLSAGVCAALWHRDMDGRVEGGEEGEGKGEEGMKRVGAYVVDVSLAGVGKYLRSLGQFEGRTGFEGEDWSVVTEAEDGLFETRDTAFGKMRFLKHSASVEGFETGWDIMPTPLGASEAVWGGS